LTGRIILTSDIHYGFEGEYTRLRLERFYRDLRKEFEPGDILVLAGDLSQGVEFLDPMCRQLRTHFVADELPVLVVFGNHDYWGKHSSASAFIRNCRSMLQTLKKHDIHYLGHNPYKIDDIILYGFDGWYWNSSPPTNDILYMPKTVNDVQVHDYMYMRCRYDVEHILRTVDRNMDGYSRDKRVIVTHFEPNDSSYGGNTHWLDPLSEHFATMLTGHTHRKSDYLHVHPKKHCRMRVHNSGSDYNIPRYKFIDL